MYTFDINAGIESLLFTGCALLLLLPVIFVYWRPLWQLKNRISREKTQSAELSASCPVSVIVYACDEAENLRYLLPTLLGQDYRGPFEVIVVNEGQSEKTAEVVDRLRMIHNNLYLTYTPDGARQLSRKKLALTLGIKAARYPVVVQTTASARIESDRWLARITEPFLDTATEVVIAPAFIDWKDEKTFGHRGRAFNDAADAAVWLHAAMSGHPYRGSELNLAYTRDIFFNNRGFSRSLNLKHGDDDIFVHEIAKPGNTAVVMHPEATVTRKPYNRPAAYRRLRSHYFFTGSKLPKLYRAKQAVGVWLILSIVALCVLGALAGLPNLFMSACGLAIILFTLIFTAILWRKAIAALTGQKLALTLPWLYLTRPFANMTAKLRSRRHRKYNYTWN